MTDRPGFLLRNMARRAARRCSLGIAAATKRGRALGVLTSAAGALLVACAPASASQSRVALLVVAEAYAPLPRSAVKAKGVEAIATALRGQGFEVSFVVDPGNAELRAAMTELAHAAEGAYAAVVVLAGHGVTSAGRTFFLPANADIARATDLLTRAVPVASVAQIAARAKHGAVLFAMTVPELPAALQGLDARPSLAGGVPANVVVAFSTSEKMPVSRADMAAQGSLRNLASVAGEKPLHLMGLVNAMTAGGAGKVVGSVEDADLSAPPPPVPKANLDSEARRAAEERARRAEERVRDAEARARQAEQRDGATLATSASTEALQTMESLFGRAQRKQIQDKLRSLGYYTGPVDAVFGELTRAAIKDYQAASGAADTGYLTPEQVQHLLKD